MNARTVSRSLGGFLLAPILAYGALGDNFRVEKYNPDHGIIEYGWDRTGEVYGQTAYTIRRNGIVVHKTGAPGIVNPYDGPFYFGETFTATLQVNNGPESMPIVVSMPRPPTPPTGGEVLWLVLSFPDVPRTITPEYQTDARTRVQWMSDTSRGRTPLTFTMQPFKLANPRATYCSNGFYDMERMKAEITAGLNLKTRPGLHRVMLDGYSIVGCQENYGYPMNSGTPMWPGSTVIAPQVNLPNSIHENFHTYGLWHFGSLPSVPADVNNLPTSISSYGGEIMGSGQMHHGLSILNYLQLGWRDASQVQRITGTTTVTLTNTHLAGGIQGALIPLSPAGAAYVIEYRGSVHVTLRPNRYASLDRTAMQVGTAAGLGGRIFSDTARGIYVDVLSANGTTASVWITVPGTATPPTTPPTTPPPTPTTTVAITSPRAGAVFPRRATAALVAVTSPAERVLTWSATCGSISGTIWYAPGAPNKSCRITASSGGASASVTVSTGR